MIPRLRYRALDANLAKIEISNTVTSKFYSGYVISESAIVLIGSDKLISGPFLFASLQKRHFQTLGSGSIFLQGLDSFLKRVKS